MANSNDQKRGSRTVDLCLGLVLIGVGILLIFQNASVATSWFVWRIGGWGMPTGITVVPLLIGVGMMLYNYRSIAARVVLILGALFVLVTLLLSVRIHFNITSLLSYVLMFGCIAAGAGLVLKSLFKRRA